MNQQETSQPQEQTEQTESQLTTGQIIEKDPILLALEEEFAIIDRQQENWLPNWYLGKLNTIEALEAVLKHQYAIMLRELAARKRLLEYSWFEPFKLAVELDLDKPENAKKKSVNYLQGRAGNRASKQSLVVVDESKAIDWALANDCQDAVDIKLARKKPLLEKYLADGVKPDGCEIVEATEKFFPSIEKPALESSPEPKRLEQENE